MSFCPPVFPGCQRLLGKRTPAGKVIANDTDLEEGMKRIAAACAQLT